MSKSILIINITNDVKTHNVADIYCHAADYGISSEHKNVTTFEEFEAALSSGKKYDYLYLAGHANETCFSDNKMFTESWSTVAKSICKSDCLNKGAILMLYCCLGGMTEVAFTLFSECPNIEYVCGAKQNMLPIQLTVGFNVFMYHVEHRKTDPVLSAQRATQATDIRFECFDRTEAERTPHYHYKFCKDCEESNKSETC